MRGIAIRSRWLRWPFRGWISHWAAYSTETIIIKLQKFLQKQNFWKPPFVAAVALKTINTISFTIRFNGKHCKRHSVCRKISRTFDVSSETLSATHARRRFNTFIHIIHTPYGVLLLSESLCSERNDCHFAFDKNFSDCSSA